MKKYYTIRKIEKKDYKVFNGKNDKSRDFVREQYLYTKHISQKYFIFIFFLRKIPSHSLSSPISSLYSQVASLSLSLVLQLAPFSLPQNGGHRSRNRLR